MISDTTLQHYVHGVLDPTEMAMIAHCLRLRPGLARRAEVLYRDLSQPEGITVPLASPEVLSWFSQAAAAQSELVMGDEDQADGALRLEMGRSFRIPLPEEASEDGVIVCLQRGEQSSWRVMWPSHPTEKLSKSDFAQPNGTHSVEVIAGEPVGLQEWCIWVLPPEVVIDWSEELDAEKRWQPILDAHRQAPRSELHVEVMA